MGGEEWGQEKVSHQKNLISHSDTHENGGGRIGWWVMDVGVVVMHMCVFLKGRGFIFSFFFITLS